jgi:hypothetical protein
VQRRPDPRERRRQRGEPVRADGETEPIDVGVRVERGQGRRPVAGQARPHGQRVGIAYQQREQPARGQHPRQPREERVRLLDVHEYAVAQHHVEAAGQEVHARLAAVALEEPHPAPDALGLGGQRLPGHGEHLRVLLEAGHLMPGPGQPQRLRALAHSDVEHPQSLPDREPAGYLLVELPGHQLLSYDITQPAQLAQPGIRRASGERCRAQGRSPRLTCGFGSRRRRIWRVRISA